MKDSRDFQNQMALLQGLRKRTQSLEVLEILEFPENARRPHPAPKEHPSR